MISFKQYLAEAAAEGKNIHMTHIEDTVVYGGAEGAANALGSLMSLRKTLSGSVSKQYDISVKWDGAPAVFAGIDPTDGKFFVAKKGIFNKNPKVYKSIADVNADTSGDLAKKLSIAFTELSKLGITGIVQGDIMFTKGDVKDESIDGKEYLVFQPNTIAYAVEKGTQISKDIAKANLGIVFHTTYTGNSFESLKASYGVDITKLKKTPSVWYDDAVIRDLSGKVSLTAAESKDIDSRIEAAKNIFTSIEKSTLKEISSNPELSATLETYYNSKIRAGTDMGDSKKYAEELLTFINKKYQKEIDTRKTEKGKAAQVAARDQFLSFFSEKNKANLIKVFDLQKAIVAIKNIMIGKLNSIGSMSTFLKTSNGYAVTGKEGFVAIDHLSNNALKLVDRLEFSKANFSPDVIKGWQKDK
jgi:hypothetical protein